MTTPKLSAGILIVLKNKVLLVHSTNASWWKSYTPPKGGVEEHESYEEAASREVFEEVKIFIDPSKLKEKIEVEYTTPTGKLYKTVHLFVHRIESLSDIGLTDEHLSFSMLQRDEVDEAKFMDAEEVKKKVLPRYLEHILPIIDTNYGK